MRVVDRLGLAVGVAGADDEEVGVAEHAAQVELDDVDRLAVGGVARRSRSASCSAAQAHAAGAPRCASRYRPRSRDRVGDRVRHEVADRPPLGDAAADVARRRCRSAACRRSARDRPPCSGVEALARCPRGGRPSRSATASVASSRTASGSRHAGRLCGHVAADDEGQLVLRIALMQLPQGIDRVGRAPAVDLERETAEALVARHREPAQLERGARRPGRSSASLCGGTATGMQQRRGRARAASRASCAQTRCPRCGGLNVPPRMPTRGVTLRRAPGRRRRRRT